MLFLRGTGGGVSVVCAILGCAVQVCLLAAVLCGSPATVCPYPMSTAGGLLLWVLRIRSYSLVFLLSAEPRISRLVRKKGVSKRECFVWGLFASLICENAIESEVDHVAGILSACPPNDKHSTHF